MGIALARLWAVGAPLGMILGLYGLIVLVTVLFCVPAYRNLD